MMHSSQTHKIQVADHETGLRLDAFVSAAVAELSRSRAAQLIQDGHIRVDGLKKKPGYRVASGEEIRIHIPPPRPSVYRPEPIHLDVLYEDRHLIAVNKTANMVVHPAPGHFSGTLVNALLYHCPDLQGIGGELRPGIVHRLDRDTSGVLVVAKSTKAHQHLTRQFKKRTIKKTYLGVVYGALAEASGEVSLPIGRHPVDRKKMSTNSRKGREAQTEWRVRERFNAATLLEILLKTGRTHQIRVHCAAIQHPIVGDAVYGGRKARKVGRSGFGGSRPELMAPRQMLHAWRIEFIHPDTLAPLLIEAPLPADMKALLDGLRNPS